MDHASGTPGRHMCAQSNTSLSAGPCLSGGGMRSPRAAPPRDAPPPSLSSSAGAVRLAPASADGSHTRSVAIFASANAVPDTSFLKLPRRSISSSLCVTQRETVPFHKPPGAGKKAGVDSRQMSRTPRPWPRMAAMERLMCPQASAYSASCPRLYHVPTLATSTSPGARSYASVATKVSIESSLTCCIIW